MTHPQLLVSDPEVHTSWSLHKLFSVKHYMFQPLYMCRNNWFSFKHKSTGPFCDRGLSCGWNLNWLPLEVNKNSISLLYMASPIWVRILNPGWKFSAAGFRSRESRREFWTCLGSSFRLHSARVDLFIALLRVRPMKRNIWTVHTTRIQLSISGKIYCSWS